MGQNDKILQVIYRVKGVTPESESGQMNVAGQQTFLVVHLLCITLEPNGADHLPKGPGGSCEML